MNKVASVVLLALVTIAGVSAQQKSERKSDTIQSIDYCKLREDPEPYNGKKIRISGIYERGFERSAFYSKACIDDTYHSRSETWIDNFYRANIASGPETSAIVSTFRSGKSGSNIEVTLTGIFRGSKGHGQFGHLNAYKFQIEVLTIEQAKLLPEEIAGCQRIDRTRPFHYLSYERIAKGTTPGYDKTKKPKTENLIYLRLANNSTCSIRVPTHSGENSQELEDESEVLIIYTLSSPCARVSWRAVSQEKQNLSILSPGRSIYFSVPLRFLTKEPYEIRIPFDMDMVKDSSYYQPFYFWRSDLPENLRKDLDCSKY